MNSKGCPGAHYGRVFQYATYQPIDHDFTPAQIERKYQQALATIQRTKPFEPESYRVQGGREQPITLPKLGRWT